MSSGVLKPAAVRRLAAIVDRHCDMHGIRSREGRESVAASALAHYQRGVNIDEQLLEILALEDDPLRHLRQQPKTSGGSGLHD